VWTVPATGGTPTPVIDTPGGAAQPAVLALPPTGLTLSVTSAPQPGYVGGAAIQVTFTVHNASARAADRVRLAIDVPPELAPRPAPQILGTLPPGGTSTVTVTLPTTQAVTGIAHALVTGVYPQDVPASAQVLTTVVVRQPVLRVDPGIGPPGFVTMASGTDFPPGTTVTLAWNPGISAPTTVVVAGDGTFQAQVLVFHHDQLGDRRLVATGAGFGAVDTGFLVVAAGLQPRDFVYRR
jgi:hypothetical protein